MTAATPTDYLKYAAALLRHRTDWALDSIGGSDCEGHDEAVAAIHDSIGAVITLASQFGDANTYSDGRKVKTSARIEQGCYTDYVWHPDPGQDDPRSWRGDLQPETEDASPPGVYEVTPDQHTQQVHVRVVRLFPAAANIPGGDPW